MFHYYYPISGANHEETIECDVCVYGATPAGGHGEGLPPLRFAAAACFVNSTAISGTEATVSLNICLGVMVFEL